MIVGLTGRNCSGKGEAVEFLKAKGFYSHSLSDVIRDEIRERGLEVTRENLIQVGNELRSRHGHGVLAQRVLERLEPDRNYVIDSIRHPAEAEALSGRSDFVLLAVQASPQIRFERIRKRNRQGDPQTLEGFQRSEEKELGNAGSERQQLDSMEGLASHRVQNETTLEEFHNRLSVLLQQQMSRMDRPGWDEYFMRIAKVASLRSNCVKRKVAAIIVRDKRVISTGYNGTPRGTKNCYEGGCPRCNSLAESGTRLDECLCSHGEENAITQAAYHGVSVKDGTLYTTFAPCLMCTKMIINAGIVEVVYNQDYPLNDTSFRLLHEAGVSCRQHAVD